MSKPLLVVAISDENYLFPLEMGLAERLYEAVDIEIISDPAYYEEFFTAPRSIDLLITDERFYSNDLIRHNIKKTIVLTEDLEDGTEYGNDGKSKQANSALKVFKYLNLQVLMSSIIPGEWIGAKSQNSVAQVIAVISAEGGCGATTIALGVAACLRQSLKRVLYINTQSLQNFHFYLQNKIALSMSGCAQMRNVSPKIYVDTKQELKQEFFTYFPPLPSARYSLGIPEKAYKELVLAALKSSEYDAIIIDIGCELTAESISMLDVATKVIIATKQHQVSAFKLGVLQKNISCNDKEKFHIICNQYDSDSENAFTSDSASGTLKVDEYIEMLPSEDLRDIKSMAKIDSIQKITYTLM